MNSPPWPHPAPPFTTAAGDSPECPEGDCGPSPPGWGPEGAERRQTPPNTRWRGVLGPFEQPNPAPTLPGWTVEVLLGASDPSPSPCNGTPRKEGWGEGSGRPGGWEVWKGHSRPQFPLPPQAGPGGADSPRPQARAAAPSSPGRIPGQVGAPGPGPAGIRCRLQLAVRRARAPERGARGPGY